MENRNKLMITAFIFIAVVGVSAFAFFSTQAQATQINNTITQQGTKLNIQNNNNQFWAHMDLVIENATLKNGTVQNLYLEVWMKPGENTTIDLSNMLGYGNAPLPTGTTIRMLSWSGLYGANAGGTGNLAMTLQGWSNTPAPSNAPQYSISQAAMPIGPLPSAVTGNIAFIGTTPEDSGPFDTDSNEGLSAEMILTVDPNGNLIITFATPPTLCSTIAHII